MKKHISQRVTAALLAAGVQRQDGLLVGFSGGRDSVALVELLREGGFSRLTLLHLDHTLRPESASDAEWCREFGRERGLEVFVERREVRGKSGARSGAGLEEAGRLARYSFFEQIATHLGMRDLVLGHHADDQVETFLFRLLRGSGSLGLGGMSPVSIRKGGAVSLRVHRPLLGVWRRELDAWIGGRKMAFCEDSSNRDLRWTRNRIRHELLPAMERVMERPVREVLWRTAELLRAEADCLRSGESAGGGNLPAWLEVKALGELPLALRRLRVARWLESLGVEGVGFELVEAVVRLAVERFPAKVNLPGGRHVRRRSGMIFLEDAPVGKGGEREAP